MISRRYFSSAALALGIASVRAGSAIAAAYPSSFPKMFLTGGSFPGWNKNAAFGSYLLSLTSAANPRICWLGAASGDCKATFNQFQEDISSLPASVTHFDIFEPSTLDFQSYLSGFDIVFVGGGSTRNLMALWREWGFDKALQAAWRSGVVMAGGSAGALCWFQAGLSDSFPKVLSPVRGMGVLTGSADVHHHTRSDRQIKFREFIANGALPSPGLALDEEVGALYHGTTLVEVVSVREGSGAWELRREDHSVVERVIPVRLLSVSV